MKFRNTLLSAVSLAVLALSSCDKEEQEAPATYPLHLHLQAYFDNDNVRLEVDNAVVFNDTVTTSPLIGLAEVIDTTATDGAHTLKIVLNQSDSITRSFSVSTELYLGIGYDVAADTFYVNPSTEAFGYD